MSTRGQHKALDSSFVLDLLLETALLQQLVGLIQDKQPDAGGGQQAQFHELLDPTCWWHREHRHHTTAPQHNTTVTGEQVEKV